jgi:[CysO sulfur-carrier protein]-S-L-cysteine hydrolase
MNGTTPQDTGLLRLAAENYEEMKADAAARAPLEACGLVAGAGGQTLKVFPVRNVLQSQVRFRMDPQEQWQVFKEIEERTWELLAIYHSHPSGPEGISAIDIAESYYPDVVHIVWFPAKGEWRCRGYRIHSGHATEIQIERIERGKRPPCKSQ